MTRNYVDMVEEVKILFEGLSNNNDVLSQLYKLDNHPTSWQMEFIFAQRHRMLVNNVAAYLDQLCNCVDVIV